MILSYVSFKSNNGSLPPPNFSPGQFGLAASAVMHVVGKYLKIN